MKTIQEINDKIRGNGSYNKVLKAIRLLKETKIRKRIAIVLMPQNVNSFKENVEEFSKSLENVDLKFSLATTVGRSNNSFRFKSEIEAENNVQFILEKLYSKRLNVVAKFEPNIKVQNCGYGEVISVSSNGEVYPCAILKYKAGNIKKNNLSEIIMKIRHDSLTSNVENLEKCPTCDLTYICFGGCRLNNITHNKNVLIPFCNDEKKNNIYRKLVLRDQFDALSIWINQHKSEYKEELC